jgi:hypothetical protein
VLDTMIARPGGMPSAWLDAVARGLIAMRVGPNVVSCAALAFGVVGAALFYADTGGGRCSRSAARG